MKKKIGLAVLAFLVVIQFIQIDKNNPAVIENQSYEDLISIPDTEQTLIINACYDCHSNTTHYPWYFSIQPLGWWLKGHVNGGREHLNFSEWGALTADEQRHKNEDCAEILEKEWMPIKSYTWAHGEAKLTAEQRAQLIVWFQKK